MWIGEWEAITAYTQDACGIITGLTAAAPLSVFEFQQDVEHAGLVQTGNFDRNNGTVWYSSVLSIKLITLDCNVRNRMVELGRSALFAVVKSNSGEYYLLGLETSGRASSAEASLGVALGDMNGLNISIEWRSGNGAFLIDSALLGTTIAIN